MGALLERYLQHDWAGVFVKSPPEGQQHVRVTAAHHGDDVFYELGVVVHEVTPEQLFAAIPKEFTAHECGDPAVEICWILDLVDERGDLVDNREVTEEQAAALLGAELAPLLEVGRGNWSAWMGDRR